MKEIHIQPVINGFIVKVGCSTVVFKDIDVLCGELKRYHLKPDDVEKEYMENAINKPMGVAGPSVAREGMDPIR